MRIETVVVNIAKGESVDDLNDAPIYEYDAGYLYTIRAILEQDIRPVHLYGVVVEVEKPIHNGIGGAVKVDRDKQVETSWDKDGQPVAWRKLRDRNSTFTNEQRAEIRQIVADALREALAQLKDGA